MVSVLRSIKPYWLYLILIGKKKIEAAKNYPVRDDWDKTCYFYCSKDLRSFKRIPEEDKKWMSKYLGTIACKVVVPDIYCVLTFPEMFAGHPLFHTHSIRAACLTNEEVLEYSNGKTVFGWLLKQLDKFDAPLELGSFVNHRGVKKAPQSWCYILSD